MLHFLALITLLEIVKLDIQFQFLLVSLLYMNETVTCLSWMFLLDSSTIWLIEIEFLNCKRSEFFFLILFYVCLVSKLQELWRQTIWRVVLRSMKCWFKSNCWIGNFRCVAALWFSLVLVWTCSLLACCHLTAISACTFEGIASRKLQKGRGSTLNLEKRVEGWNTSITKILGIICILFIL